MCSCCLRRRPTERCFTGWKHKNCSQTRWSWSIKRQDHLVWLLIWHLRSRVSLHVEILGSLCRFHHGSELSFIALFFCVWIECPVHDFPDGFQISVSVEHIGQEITSFHPLVPCVYGNQLRLFGMAVGILFGPVQQGCEALESCKVKKLFPIYSIF